MSSFFCHNDNEKRKCTRIFPVFLQLYPSYTLCILKKYIHLKIFNDSISQFWAFLFCLLRPNLASLHMSLPHTQQTNTRHRNLISLLLERKQKRNGLLNVVLYKTDLADILWLQAQHSLQFQLPHGQGLLGRHLYACSQKGGTGPCGTLQSTQSAAVRAEQ